MQPPALPGAQHQPPNPLVDYITNMASPAGVKLTPKRRSYLAAYFGPAKQSPTEAARIAGLPNPNVSGAQYKKRLLHVIDALTLKALEVGCLGAQEVIQEVSLIAKNDPSTSNRLRALEMLAKIHGLLTDKVAVTLDRKQLEIDIAASVGNLRRDVAPQLLERDANAD